MKRQEAKSRRGEDGLWSLWWCVCSVLQNWPVFYPNQADEAASCHSSDDQYSPPATHIHSFIYMRIQIQAGCTHTTSCTPCSITATLHLSLPEGWSTGIQSWLMACHTHDNRRTANEQTHSCAVSTHTQRHGLPTLLRSARSRQSVCVCVELEMVWTSAQLVETVSCCYFLQALTCVPCRFCVAVFSLIVGFLRDQSHVTWRTKTSL